MMDSKWLIWLGLVILLFPVNNEGADDKDCSICKKELKDAGVTETIGCATKGDKGYCVECSNSTTIKIAADNGYDVSGCISIVLIVIGVIVLILIVTGIVLLICFCVPACPLYQWRMRQKGGRGGGGASRAASARNVPSKASQKAGTRPPTASSSRATKH